MSNFLIKSELAKTEKQAQKVYDSALLFLIENGTIPESALPDNAKETLQYKKKLQDLL